jgi:beta-xylosidase
MAVLLAIGAAWGCQATIHLDESSPRPDAVQGDAGAPAPGDDGAAPAVDDEVPSPTTYANPVIAADFPDPFVLREGDAFYAFSTNAHGKNVPAAVSRDLASWTELPDALPSLPSWARANASLTWAPSVLRRGAMYVLYYTARWDAVGFQCIGRALSSTPEGPYSDDTNVPFLCQVSAPAALCGSIDPSPFVDENGDAYLLWKSDENAPACATNSRIWIQRLGIDGLSLVGEPTILLTRDRNWEAPLVEGPSLVKHDDQYHLFYSGGWWESEHYGVGHALCAAVTGPCEKQTLHAPLLGATTDVLGPGGQEIFTDDEGAFWMVYHAWSAPVVGYSNGGRRSMRIDRVTFSAGVPQIAGPTVTPQLRRGAAEERIEK